MVHATGHQAELGVDLIHGVSGDGQVGQVERGDSVHIEEVDEQPIAGIVVDLQGRAGDAEVVDRDPGAIVGQNLQTVAIVPRGTGPDDQVGGCYPVGQHDGHPRTIQQRSRITRVVVERVVTQDSRGGSQRDRRGRSVGDELEAHAIADFAGGVAVVIAGGEVVHGERAIRSVIHPDVESVSVVQIRNDMIERHIGDGPRPIHINVHAIGGEHRRLATVGDGDIGQVRSERPGHTGDHGRAELVQRADVDIDPAQSAVADCGSVHIEGQRAAIEHIQVDPATTAAVDGQAGREVKRRTGTRVVDLHIQAIEADAAGAVVGQVQHSGDERGQRRAVLNIDLHPVLTVQSRDDVVELGDGRGDAQIETDIDPVPNVVRGGQPVEGQRRGRGTRDSVAVDVDVQSIGEGRADIDGVERDRGRVTGSEHRHINVDPVTATSEGGVDSGHVDRAVTEPNDGGCDTVAKRIAGIHRVKGDRRRVGGIGHEGDEIHPITPQGPGSIHIGQIDRTRTGDVEQVHQYAGQSGVAGIESIETDDRRARLRPDRQHVHAVVRGSIHIDIVRDKPPQPARPDGDDFQTIPPGVRGRHVVELVDEQIEATGRADVDPVVGGIIGRDQVEPHVGK